MHKNVFKLPVSFTGSYTKDEPIFHDEILTIFTENDVA